MRFFSTTLIVKACGVSEGGRDDMEWRGESCDIEMSESVDRSRGGKAMPQAEFD